MLNTEGKNPKGEGAVRGSGAELRIPAACGAPGSPAPVLGYTMWVDSARESKPREGLEINVFGGGN